MSTSSPSIFTQIIKGDIPCYFIDENENFFAFLDINPAAKGHTLIIPKYEVDYFFDLSETYLKTYLIFAKTIAKAIDKALKPLRTGMIVEGMEVPHAHLHLIPIYTASQSFRLGKQVELSSDEMTQIAESIRQTLK